MIATLNVALRFVLELGGVAAVGYWGFRVGPGMPLRLLLGIGAPALLIVVWAIVVAPGAANPIPQSARIVLGTLLLELAAGALVLAGQPTLGVWFAIVVLVNALLMFVLPR